MKLTLLIVFAIIFAVTLTWLDACATPATCTISGTIYDGAGNPVPLATIYFNSQNTQVVNNTTVYPVLVTSTTNASGVLSTTALIQGLFVQITICQPQGGGCAASTTGFVPLVNAATFQNLLSGQAVTTSGALTGNLNAMGFRITNLGANTTLGDALSQGQSSLNNLTSATGNYSMGSHKLINLIAGTGSGDSLAFGLNTLSDLAAAGANYPMGSHKLTGLIAGTTSGDSLAFGLNDLSQLATSTGNYSMGGFKLQSVAVAAATGDALSEGHAIGSQTPSTGVFTNLVATGQFIPGGSFNSFPQSFSEVSGGTITPALGGGTDVAITITDNGGWTLANPSSAININAFHWWIKVTNSSGGAGGTITLGANYRTDTSWSATGPANGKTRICPVWSSQYNGTHYIGPCTGDETN